MTARTDLLRRAPHAALPRRGEKVLCAVSGGLDSMCLLRMLEAWCEERGGQVMAAHFNHRLRTRADRDEEFVRETCESWGIPLSVGRGDVGEHARREGLSTEEAARNLRYAFLRRAAAEAGCKRVYTAHHADDNAETILLNLIRGTGLAGLTGMDWEREGLCRPLLGAARAELEEYAAEWKIPHMEDETNADPEAAARNLLRLQVMPLLKELNPRAVEHICGAARRLRGVDRSLEADAAARTAHVEVQEGRVTLSMEALAAAPAAVRPRMLLWLFDLLGVGRKDVGAAHLEALMDLARRTAWGKEGRLSLPHGVTARYCRRWLILETRPQTLTEVQLVPGRSLRWGDYALTLLDRPEGEGISFFWRGRPGQSPVVTAAPCPPGERLTLPGARGSRSVKRLCLDRRISLAERDRLPAIYVEGELAAVWRLGVDAAFAPEGGAPCRFIKIEKQIEEDGHDAQ
ncbi:tRNA lysidine(34) synthetase TilS [uncultured Oscillibacter sp.]|jgi:tRNA(Ile)-lysidine synthase|uniref:tRNA lysidine(34) synthetase TilS n=1 Tax=uncultured Oscillibacter sp. TaxID=876091 RepID=UPI0025F051E9|nr:tRNA lysidine(34) synthetase TilS [uncultured Oscillibacter sp.]